MSQLLMNNVSSELASGSVNSIHRLAAHQSNFVTAGDLATYLSRHPGVGEALQRNDLANVQSTQLDKTLQQPQAAMLEDVNAAMARIHSEAFPPNKELAK